MARFGTAGAKKWGAWSSVLAWKMLAVAVVDWKDQEEVDPWAGAGLAVVEWW